MKNDRHFVKNDRYFMVRCTGLEYQAWCRAAKRAKKTLAEWARDSLDGCAGMLSGTPLRREEKVVAAGYPRMVSMSAWDEAVAGGFADVEEVRRIVAVAKRRGEKDER